MTTLHFYAPDWDREPDMIERRDQRVRLVDYNGITMTHKVEFTDGYRAVVRSVELLRREAQ